jgi:O-antigen ligase
MTGGQTYGAAAWRDGGGGATTNASLGAVAVLLVLGLGGYLVHPVLGFGVIALLAAPVFVVAPKYALLALVALLPFDAVSALDANGATLTRLLGMAIMGGWVVHVLVEGTTVRVTRSAMVLALYVAFAALSIGWAADPGVAVRALATLVQLLLLGILMADVVREPADIQRTVDAMLVGSLLLAVAVLWEIPADGLKRATFTFGPTSINPNFLGGMLALPAVAALGLGRMRGPWGWWRLATVVPITLALFLTGSRGATIALVAGVLVVGALRRRIGLGVVVLGVAVTLLLPAIVPDAVLDKLLTRYSSAEEDRLSGRMDIWRVALVMAEDKPLQGTGYGGFQDAFYRYMLTAPVDPHFARMHSRGNRASHNIYLGTLAELGIVGLGILVVALWTHGRALWRARLAALRRRDETMARLTLALLGVFATLAISGTTIDLLDAKAPWVWLALMQAAACVAARPVRAGSRA